MRANSQITNTAAVAIVVFSAGADATQKPSSVILNPDDVIPNTFGASVKFENQDAVTATECTVRVTSWKEAPTSDGVRYSSSSESSDLKGEIDKEKSYSIKGKNLFCQSISETKLFTCLIWFFLTPFRSGVNTKNSIYTPTH